MVFVIVLVCSLPNFVIASNSTGGGGAGGSGLIIDTSTSVPMMSRDGWRAMVQLFASTAVMALWSFDSRQLV